MLHLVFLIGVPLALWLIGVWKLTYGLPAVVVALLGLPIIATALTPILLVAAILAWERGYWSLLERSHYSVVTLAAIAFIPFLLYWNLLGFQF